MTECALHLKAKKINHCRELKMFVSWHVHPFFCGYTYTQHLFTNFICLLDDSKHCETKPNPDHSQRSRCMRNI